jgi:hypothetical protein
MADRVMPLRVGDVELLVEVSHALGTERTSSKLERAQDALGDAFDRAKSAIVAVGESTVDVIDRMSQKARPHQVEVKFGLKFSAQGNVVLAGASGEATLDVKLVYLTGNDPPGDPKVVSGD